MQFNLHLGLKTRPSACKTVIVSSVPNDWSFDFFFTFFERVDFDFDWLSFSDWTGNLIESEMRQKKKLGIKLFVNSYLSLLI